MMKPRRVALAVLVLAAAVPFLFAGPRRPFVRSGHGLDEGKILLVGKIVLDPPVAGKGGMWGIWINMTDDLAQPVVFKKKGAKLDEDEYMGFDREGTSYISITPGTRYIRLTRVPLSSSGPTFSMSGWMTNPGRTSFLELAGDLKVTVPQGVKAVYIGTLVYRHDGWKTKRIAVRDDYPSAMADLAKWKITGVSQRDVVKRLAQVVRQP